MTHVPYRGTGPAIQDLVGERIDVLFLPKGASADLVSTLNGAAVQAMKSSSVRVRLGELGAQLFPTTARPPNILRSSSSSEIEKWAGRSRLAA